MQPESERLVRQQCLAETEGQERGKSGSGCGIGSDVAASHCRWKGSF